MAGELQRRYTTAATVYAHVRSAVGTIWNGTALEAYLTANIATYDVAMIEQGTASQMHVGTFPATAVAGTYQVTYWERVGGSPAETDTYIATEVVEWNGSILLPRAAWALVDSDPVSMARTWTARTDQVTCREIVEVTTQDTAVYAMDFSLPGVLNPKTSLLTADSVTDESGNALTTSKVVLSQNKMAVHFTVTGSDLAADTTYSMRATTTATDGLVFARIGTLKSL